MSGKKELLVSAGIGVVTSMVFLYAIDPPFGVAAVSVGALLGGLAGLRVEFPPSRYSPLSAFLRVLLLGPLPLVGLALVHVGTMLLAVFSWVAGAALIRAGVSLLGKSNGAGTPE